jgi:(5-formylfuran-3-yl)methyl phosphate synthase
MTQLLVSVRSAVEARAAVAGGASIIDVKEPRRGSLGRADVATWGDVRGVVPGSIPVSVALGELNEWSTQAAEGIPRLAWSGIAFRKLGLSGATDWRERWSELRRGLDRDSPSGVRPDWIAVVYTDWKRAQAPDPESVIDAAIAIDECRGVLFDTWDKSTATVTDRTCERQLDRIRQAGRLIALAGKLDVESIVRLKALSPDIFAVRGAACQGGDRLGPIDPDRVAMLAQAVHGNSLLATDGTRIKHG